MKIKILYLVLLIISLRSTTLICTNKKPRDYSKAEVDKLTKDKTPRELARENLELRRRLSQTESEPDLEMGLAIDAPAGAGVGAPGPIKSPHSMMRHRTASIHSEDPLAGSVDSFHGTVADFLALQQTQNELHRRADDDRTKFQQQVYRDIKCSKRSAMLGTGLAIMYTTAGFIIQNWPSIISRFGGSSGPGGHPGNNTGTNSTSGF